MSSNLGLQISQVTYMRGSRGGGGAAVGPDVLKNHKNIRFRCNTGLDSLQNHKATKRTISDRPSLPRQQNVL